MRQKLKILLITDSKKGHENSSISVIKGLNEISNRDCEIIKLFVKIRLKVLLTLLNFLIKFSITKSFLIKHPKLLNVFYKIRSPKKIDFENIDYIVSSGGDTSYVNIILSKFYNIKNIYASRLRKLDPEDFYLIVTTFKKDVYTNSIYLDFPPFMNQKEISSNFITNMNLDKKAAILLIGGDGAGYKYKSNEFSEILYGFLDFIQRNNLYGFITTSRRTKKVNDILLKEIYEKINIENTIKYFIFFNLKEEYLLDSYFQIADYIFVTEDSGSMITESLLTNKPTYTIYPSTFKEEKLYSDFIKENEKFISKRLQIKELSNVDLKFSQTNNIESPFDVFKSKLIKFLEENK